MARRCIRSTCTNVLNVEASKGKRLEISRTRTGKTCLMNKKYFTKEERLQAKREANKRYRANWTPEQLKKASDRGKRFYYTHKKEQQKRIRDWRSEDWRRALLHSARSRAKQKGIPFNLDLGDIIVPKKCPILKIPLFKGVETQCENSPSLDRVIPDKGYVKGNVRVISYSANRLKGNITKPILRRLNKYVFG